MGEYFQKYFLAQFLPVSGIVDHAEDDHRHQALVFDDKGLHGLAVAGLDLADQQTGRLGCFVHACFCFS